MHESRPAARRPSSFALAAVGTALLAIAVAPLAACDLGSKIATADAGSDAVDLAPMVDSPAAMPDLLSIDLPPADLVSLDVATDFPLQPTLTTLKMRFFTLTCSGCHDGTAANNAPMLPGGQDLTPSKVHASIVNVPSVERTDLMRVKPGDPDNSYLYLKLEKMMGDPAIQKNQMPLDGPYLTPADLALVRAWIVAGALDN